MRKTPVFALIAALVIAWGAAALAPGQPPALARSASEAIDLYFPVSFYHYPLEAEILPNHTSFTSAGALHIVGEVKNPSDVSLGVLAIRAHLRNDHEDDLGSELAYIYLDDLPAGETTCFDVTFLSPPRGWTHYTFDSPIFQLPGSPAPRLTLLSTGANLKSDSEYQVFGQVKNEQGQRVECVRPVVTLFDDNGEVLGCGYTYVDGYHLYSNQTANFSLTFMDRKYKDVDAFRVQVHGDVK